MFVSLLYLTTGVLKKNEKQQTPQFRNKIQYLIVETEEESIPKTHIHLTSMTTQINP